METILQARGLKKYYGKGEALVRALDGVDLDIERGKFTAIIGTSGSGKSTLLNMLGGLDTPRAPAELQPDGRVVNADGEDVTAAYQAGAEAALRIAKQSGCTAAVLKARSPSCGCGEVYDGTFTHTLKGGWGLTARLLREAGLAVMDEENMDSRLFLPEVRD